MRVGQHLLRRLAQRGRRRPRIPAHRPGEGAPSRRVPGRLGQQRDLVGPQPAPQRLDRDDQALRDRDGTGQRLQHLADRLKHPVPRGDLVKQPVPLHRACRVPGVERDQVKLVAMWRAVVRAEDRDDPAEPARAHNRDGPGTDDARGRRQAAVTRSRRGGPDVCFGHRLLERRGQPDRAARRAERERRPVGELSGGQAERGGADQPLIGHQVDAQPLGAKGSAERGQDQRQAGGRIGRHQPVGQPVQAAELAARRGVHLLAGQQRDHVVGVGGARIQVARDPALPQHHDPVGEPEHLLDVVTGEQNSGALLAQAHDQRFDLRRLLDAQGCRGLVQGQQQRPLPHRAGERHELALPTGQGAHAARGVGERDAQVLEHLRRGGVEPALREHQPPRLVAEQHVGRDVQVFAERQVLPDHGDALLRRGHRVGRHLAARQVDLATGRADVPGDAAHQRGLASAVLARQGDQLTGLDGQVHPAERAHRPEAGLEPGHGQQRGRRRAVGQRE